MITKSDILVSLGMATTWIIFMILSVEDESPDFSVPKLHEPVTFSENTPTTTPEAPNWNFNFNIKFMRTTLSVLAVIIILLIIIFFFWGSSFKFTAKSKKKKKEKSLKEKILDLNKARKQARARLLQGLEEGEYTNTIIEAYQLLDKGLQGFRKVARPKHMTPKEYAFTVYEPVFKSSVRGIVEIFYKIQYGMQQGTRQQVEDFLFFLDRIFSDDVKTLDEIQAVEQRAYQYRTDYTKSTIPHVQDFTKPFRRQTQNDE